MEKNLYIKYYKIVQNKYESEKDILIKTYLKDFEKDFWFWNIYININDVFTNKQNNFKNDLWFLFVNFMWNIDWKIANNLYFKNEYLYNTFKTFKKLMNINEKKYKEATDELDEKYTWKRNSDFLNIPCYISHWLL